MAEGRQVIRLALFGRPVSASLSPSIHRQFADQFGMAVDYRAIEAGIDDFPGALDEFRRAGGGGCNITLPLKGLAWKCAAACSREADEAQAANTLTAREAGWYAHNTDGVGFIGDLCVNQKVDPAGKDVVVLGAGGAAAGILGALLMKAPRRLVLVNRDTDRAVALAERFKGKVDIGVCGWAGLSALGGFDLVVNATSLGHAGQAPALGPGLFAPGAVCYDLNYGKAARPLQALCEDLGQPYVDGLGMLIEQAAASFESWTGRRPDSRAVIASYR